MMRRSKKTGRMLRQIYPQRRLKKAEIAWLAAMIEGEGHIGWNTNTRQQRVPVLQVSMVDRDVVVRIAKMFCTPARGPYGPYGTNRQSHYRAHAYGRAATRILKLILPWLGKRRGKRAREILRGWKYHRVTNNKKTGRLEVAK